MAVGRVVLVVGVLILLFIPYLLWGTGLQTARSQDQLRTEFTAAQHRVGEGTVQRPAAPPKHAASTPPALAPAIAPPAIGGPVGVIDIPKIDLNMVVVEGTGDRPTPTGARATTPVRRCPAQQGNVAIAGHRTTYLHPFYNLNELVPGDSILLTTVQGKFLYQMTSSQVVSPVRCVGRRRHHVAPTHPDHLQPAVQRHHPVGGPRRVGGQRPGPSEDAGGRPRPRPSPALSLPATPAKNWFAAIGLGLVVAIVITGIWIAARKTRRGQRAAVIVVGLVAWLVLVFFFFEALAPLLPASF